MLALSFGVLAREAGFSALGALVMSAIVFAGSAQFAAISIIAAGGGVGAAIGAAALMNARFLPMGIALAPSLPGPPLLRAAQGQTIVDASWAMANQGDGSFDRHFLFGASAVQYVTWLLGTAAGAFGGDALGDPRDLGLDAIFPAFFLALLLPELRDARSRGSGAGRRADRPGARAAHAAGRAGPRGERGGARRPEATPRARHGCAGRMTGELWALIAGCAAVTFAIKAAGPVTLGGRELPRAPASA